MFRTVFPSIIRSSKLRISLQVIVRPILLLAASLTKLAAGTSIGLTNWLLYTRKQTGKDYDTAYSVIDNKIFIAFDDLHSLLSTLFLFYCREAQLCARLKA
jgi:hypothetical protein